MQITATDGVTEPVEADEATYAVGLPTSKHGHHDGLGTDTLLGPITVDTDGREEFRVASDAVERVLDGRQVLLPSLTREEMPAYRIPPEPEFVATGDDLRAYEATDLTHIVRNHDLSDETYEEDKPIRFIVGIPGDGDDREGRRRLDPDGSIIAPYLVGPITIPAAGAIKTHVHLKAAYRAVDLTNHLAANIKTDESLPVYRVSHHAGSAKCLF